MTVAGGDGTRPAIVRILREEGDDIAAEWRELCRWDPSLPPDSNPPIAPALISAVADALEHPQPLGWGADPEMEKVVGAFALSAGSLEVAIGQLVCFGEALRRRVLGRLPTSESTESNVRLEMLIDRAIGAAAQQAAARNQVETLVDAHTGLLNARALERDLRRELARADRHRRPVCLVVMVTSTGFDNLASALAEFLRAGDLTYCLGEDELAAVLADAGKAEGVAVISRLEDSGVASFRAGCATYPDDGTDGETLLDIARRGAGR
jgi:hypothetical protein